MSPKNEDGETETIIYECCNRGLGIKIIGGVDENEDYGIYVKRILAGGLAAQDGRLQAGDLVLEVNGESLRCVRNGQAVALLRQASASNYIKLVISRSQDAKEEFLELMDAVNGYSYSSGGSACDQQSNCSRTSSPSLSGKQRWLSEEGPLQKSRLSSGSSTPTPLTDILSAQILGGVNIEETSQPLRLTGGHNGRQYNVAQNARLPGNMELQAKEQTTSHNLKVNGYPQAGRAEPGFKPVNTIAGNTYQPRVLQPPTFSSTPQDGSTDLGVPSAKKPVKLGGASAASSKLMTPSPVTGTLSFQKTQESTAEEQDLEKKLSLDPHVRLKIERLEVALNYLGVEPTPAQNAELRKRLQVDQAGSVTYGEFVRVAREMFKFDLKQRNINPASFSYSSADITNFTEPPAFTSPIDHIPGLSVQEEFDYVKKERDALRKEVERLKLHLKEKDHACRIAEDELLRIRKEAQGAMEESRSLKSKVHLADQAQRAARGMEKDYEEVVRLLEAELAEAKEKQSTVLENPAVQKRVAVLASQLKKAEKNKKTYEVANEKLIQFAEHVREVLHGQMDKGGVRTSIAGKPTIGRLQSHIADSLTEEATNVIKTVKSLVEVEELPFGWDVAYTEDGMKYYINHITQCTTWSHPVSNVNHSMQQLPPPPQLKAPPPRPPSGLLALAGKSTATTSTGDSRHQT